MSWLRLLLCCFALAGVGALVLSCGSGSQHQLENISMAPVFADAQQYPGGQVPFVVTGYYNTAPMTVTPIPAKYGACSHPPPPVLPTSTTEVSVSTSGVAQCGVGANGFYLIWANAPLPNGTYSCPSDNGCGTGCVLAATAQLTCP
jgi:hypothetical protein